LRHADARRAELEAGLRQADARLEAETARRAELESALRDAHMRIEAEAGRRSEAEAELRCSVATHERLRGERDALLGSTSWRLTAPLRALSRRLSRLSRTAK